MNKEIVRLGVRKTIEDMVIAIDPGNLEDGVFGAGAGLGWK